MNKAQFIELIHRKAANQYDPPLTISDITFLVDLILDTMTEHLVSGEKDGEPEVSFRGFGRLARVVRKGRVYKVHGKDHPTQDRYQIVFRIGSEFKRALPDYNAE